MMLESLCLLSDAQALTASAASTNHYDQGAAIPNSFTGEPLAVLFTVDVAAKTSDSNETYSFAVATDTTTTITPDTTLATVAIPRATLVAGYKFALPIPNRGGDRYLAAYYTLGGTNPTITVTASIVPLNFVDSFVAMADGFNIA